jgi:hypothetical protein
MVSQSGGIALNANRNYGTDPATATENANIRSDTRSDCRTLSAQLQLSLRPRCKLERGVKFLQGLMLLPIVEFAAYHDLVMSQLREKEH